MTRQKPNSATSRRSTGAALVAALVLWGLQAPPAAAEDVNRIVLRVNDEILTLHEYETRKASDISALLSDQRLDSAERQERLEQIGRLVMQSTFSEMLLLSFAQQQGIRVSDAEVEEAVKTLMERQGIETDEQLQEALRGSNMTLEEVRENARRELLWQQVVSREVQPKVLLSEEEMRAYYRNNQDEFRTPEQRWLKEIIVLEESGLEDAELKRIAEEIQAALAAGGDAEAIVEPYREKGIATGLIDLEWLHADELESSLSAAAWALKPGEYSTPVAARGGYHIVHVAGLREETLKPLSEVQNLIMQREYNKRFNRQIRVFLAELENNAFIQENLPPEAVGYRALSSEFEPEDELELFRAPEVPSVKEGRRKPTDTAAEGEASG